MAFTDRWTLLQLRTSARRVLADPAGRFWSDAELNNYIDEWQSNLQDQFEFAWNTATITTSLSTHTITNIATDIMRLDAVYWNEWRLNGRTKQNLDDIVREWRAALAGSSQPRAVYQNDHRSFGLWPPVSTSGTLILEYPRELSLVHDTDVMDIPAWTRYNCKDYVAYKAYLREGPANSPTKAMRYKQRWEAGVKRIRTIWDNYFPGKALRLKPASSYEYDIILARGSSDGSRNDDMALFFDETPTGTIDGVNVTFTLSVAPTELILTLNGLTMTEGIDYTYTGYTITMITVPLTGDTLRAYIYRG